MNRSILVVALLSASISPAFSRSGSFPPGPEWYVDDQHIYRSIRSDWPGLTLQGRAGIRRAHRQGAARDNTSQD
jgi:hypothetical protein